MKLLCVNEGIHTITGNKTWVIENLIKNSIKLIDFSWLNQPTVVLWLNNGRNSTY